MRTSNACPSPHLAARTSVASSSWPAMFCRSASASWRDAEFCIFVSNSCVRANCAGIVMMSPFLSFREGDPFLGSFRDFHEPFLNELRHPRHRIRVKDRDHLSLGVPVGNVVLDELKVEDRSWQIPFERQGRDTEGNPHFR